MFVRAAESNIQQAREARSLAFTTEKWQTCSEQENRCNSAAITYYYAALETLRVGTGPKPRPRIP